MTIPIRQRYRGTLLGLAIGDALGTTVEFSPPGSFPLVTDMTGGGPFNLPAGAWTDDTSMALCLADSLIERRTFDPVDQLQRYVRWYREGHNSSTGRCFDIGNATRAALERFERTGEPYPGDAAPKAAGNGPLMKLAPVVLAYANLPAAAVEHAAASARTTHGDPEAADACRYFAALLIGALAGQDRDALLRPLNRSTIAEHLSLELLAPKVATVAGGSFLTREPPKIKGAGYIVQALEAALWALRSTSSFEEGVLAAVNLGHDTDTTAAIYGQLAGALYGVEAIPQRWRDRVYWHDEIVARADALLELAASPLAPPTPPPPNDSYWVFEGRVLAGPYPGAPTKADARAKLESFLHHGVTSFVDLTEEGEGPPLHRYAPLLRTIASERGVDVSYHRLPIRDLGVPTEWQLRATLAVIREALAAGEVVYVHCWGGVGRTGTVIGALLTEAGCPAEQVLDRLAALRAGTAREHRTSPETQPQRDLVRQWIPGEPVTVPSLGELVALLRRQNALTLFGPDADERIHAEVRDDAHDQPRTIRVAVTTRPDASAELSRLGLERDELLPGGSRILPRTTDGYADLAGAAKAMLEIAQTRWPVCRIGLLGAGVVPPSDAPWAALESFAMTFDGYAHCGEHAEAQARLAGWERQRARTGRLPSDVDDLRAMLFLQFRADRFSYGDDVTLVENEEGVLVVRNNPDFDASPQSVQRRELVDAIRAALLAAARW